MVEHVRVRRELRFRVVALHDQEPCRPGPHDLLLTAIPSEVSGLDDAAAVIASLVEKRTERTSVSLNADGLVPADPKNRDDVVVLRGVQAPGVRSHDDALGHAKEGLDLV